MEIRTIKLAYFVLSLVLVVLSLGYSFLSSFESELEKDITELRSLNVKLEETKGNLSKILSQTTELYTFDQLQAKERILEYVDKLAQKYNIEIKETPKVDENNRTVSMIIAITSQITNKKQIEELLSSTASQDVFFLIRDLEVSFSKDKGYFLNLTVEIKNVFTKH
jgi:arginine utilization protein RocB